VGHKDIRGESAEGSDRHLGGENASITELEGLREPAGWLIERDWAQNTAFFL